MILLQEIYLKYLQNIYFCFQASMCQYKQVLSSWTADKGEPQSSNVLILTYFSRKPKLNKLIVSK